MFTSCYGMVSAKSMLYRRREEKKIEDKKETRFKWIDQCILVIVRKHHTMMIC